MRSAVYGCFVGGVMRDQEFSDFLLNGSAVLVGGPLYARDQVVRHVSYR